MITRAPVELTFSVMALIFAVGNSPERKISTASAFAIRRSYLPVGIRIFRSLSRISGCPTRTGLVGRWNFIGRGMFVSFARHPGRYLKFGFNWIVVSVNEKAIRRIPSFP